MSMVAESESNPTNNNNNNNNNTTGITIRVLFFASAREAVGGRSEIQWTFPNDDDAAPADTEQLRIQLAKSYPNLSTLILDRESITLAVNEEYVLENTILKQGDVVAIIPPISGG
jgi:molybdopterin converting factor subunit 1